MFEQDKLVSSSAVITDFTTRFPSLEHEPMRKVLAEILQQQRAESSFASLHDKEGRMTSVGGIELYSEFLIGSLPLPFAVIHRYAKGDVIVKARASVGVVPFDKKGSNNWGKSEVRRVLNSSWLKKFLKSNPELRRGIIPMLRELKGERRQPLEYKMCMDNVSLLTTEEYRRWDRPDFHKQWLITPYTINTEIGMIVNDDGCVTRQSVVNDVPVYPILHLKPEFKVYPLDNNFGYSLEEI